MRLLLAFFILVVVLSCDSDDDPITPQNGGGQSLECPDSNHTPVLVSIPDTTVAPGTTLTLQPVAYDLDGDELTYRAAVSSNLSDLRRGTLPVYTFDPELRILNFEVRESDRPGRAVYFYASEPCGAADTLRVYVAVP